jgi:hypothetical protein
VNLPTCQQFPGAGPLDDRTETPLKTVQDRSERVRLPHNFHTLSVVVDDAGAAGSLVRFGKIGIEQEGGVALRTWEQVAIAVERNRDRRVAHECLQRLFKPQYASPTSIPAMAQILNSLIRSSQGTPTTPLPIDQGAGGIIDGTLPTVPGVGPDDAITVAG